MNQSFHLLPDSASELANEVDILAFALLAICTIFSLGIAAAILVFIAKYWHNRDANREISHSVTMHWIVESIWSIGPMVILIGVFAWGAEIYVHDREPASNAEQINVVGKQWMWKVSHESGRREINSLHIPTETPVRLTMISDDVIHSFFVPAFRVKQDVLPGRYSTLWFNATKLGTYHLFCAEYCGTQHSKMIGTVTVMTPEQYSAWTSDTTQESLAQKGLRNIVAAGCLQCHSMIDGTMKAPPLTGLYDHSIPLSDGKSVVAHESFLRRSILEPSVQVHAGFDANMPSYQGQLDPEQVLEIIAYLKSIEDASGPYAGPGTSTSFTDSEASDMPATPQKNSSSIEKSLNEREKENGQPGKGTK